ncbi:Wall-associated receptor kinase [Theobroma cacao]|nr:Wall-associated receptor kinase [Theobroma cacao]
MLKAQVSLFWLMAVALLLFLDLCIARREISKACGSSHCGNVTVSYPFRLKSQPPGCGLQLECNDNNITTLALGTLKYYVQEIFNENQAIRVMVTDERLSSDDCSFPPPLRSSFDFIGTEIGDALVVHTHHLILQFPNSLFYVSNERTPPGDFNQSCIVIAQVPFMFENIIGLSTSDIYEKLLLGYEITWRDSDGRCPWHWSGCDNKVSFQDILARLLYNLRIYVDSFQYFLFHGDLYPVYHVPNRTYIICLAITGN